VTVRTDDDTWDITESVGATALLVAAARAAETESARPLFDDPFARVFLDAAGEGTWNKFGNSSEPRLRVLQDFFAARTAFVDDFFLSAARAGIRQVVILAAGLDARAWRLPWPDGTRVFELDLPKVLDFKSSTLQARGAQPTALRTEIAVDLRQDWPTALRQNGFDTDAPTAWSVEGLLRYLPSQAQDLLFERILDLSAVGSRIVTNAPTDEALERADDQLAYRERRADVTEWLTERGWAATATTVPDAVARYRGRPVEIVENGGVPSIFVAAQLVAGREP
jgi:methyltransferase (TIGR00027 family)